jgi:hypothetical protein
VMDAETQDLLRSSLIKLFADASGGSLADRLAGLGWDEVLGDDEPGALRVLFETKGETRSGGDALGPCLARTVARSLGVDELRSAAVALPLSMGSSRLSSRLVGDSMAVSGLMLSMPETGSPVVVPFEGTDGPTRLAVLTSDAAWVYKPVAGTDPDLGLLRVNASAPTSRVELLDADRSAAAWEMAIALGRWAVAAELVGLGRRVIADAVEYSLQRKQFGRQIGSFQALQHRLAGADASVVGAEHAVEEAASSGSPWVAMVAKALAGRAADSACSQAQQVYGAIGFTWEHGFHNYLRRAYLLDRLLGDWRQLEVEIGTQLLATGEVPRIGML